MNNKKLFPKGDCQRLVIGFALVLIALACGSGPARTGPPPTRKIIERLATKTPALALAPSPVTRTPTLEPARLISPTELPSVAAPSPASTEPPTVEVLLPMATASENTVNLRAGPGTGYDLAGSLAVGESLEIAGRNGDSSWWQVSGPNGLAWVAASVVTAEHTSDAIAVVEAPPMPTPWPTLAPAVVEPVSPMAAPLSATPIPPTPPAGPAVKIAAVNHRDEYVDLQNAGAAPQDLSGWRLFSEHGAQDCPLSGAIQPGESLRIWAMTADASQGGYNCGFGTNIWNNSEPDAAVLYDATGAEVSRK